MCKAAPCSRQITMPAPYHSVFTVWMTFLSPNQHCQSTVYSVYSKKGSPYSITERSRILELIPVLRSQPAGDVNHKLDGRLPLLSARPAVTPATLKKAATNFAAW